MTRRATGLLPSTEKFNTLRGLAFFKNFSDVDLWQVVRISTWSRHPAGTTVIRQGDAGRSFFILAAGEVRVTKSEKLLNVLKAGECFGEMAYISRANGSVRSADVVTLSDSRVITIRNEDSAPLRMQVQALAWRQDGRRQLPTDLPR